MADDTDIQPPQDTYSGGQPVMSRVDPDGQEYIWDQQSRKMVSIGPVTDPARLAIIRARSTPTYEDANRKAAMEQGAEADRINAQRDTSTPEERQSRGQKVMDAWLSDAVSAMSPEAKASMRPQDVARSPQPASIVQPQTPVVAPIQAPSAPTHQSTPEEIADRLQLFDKLHGDPVQDRSVTLGYVKRLLGGTSGTETPTESNPEGKAQVSPIEQASATKTLTDQMRKEEASLMPAPRPQTPAPITPPQTGTQPMPQAPVLPPGGSPIAPPQPQMADPATIARLRAQRPVPGTRTPPSPASIQSYNLQMYQRAVPIMGQKAAAALYLPGMLAAQGSAQTLKPTWVPADATTGAPGHFETSKGTIHVPPQAKPAPVVKATGKLSEVQHAELTSGLSELNANERDARKALSAARAGRKFEEAGKALDDLKKIQADRKKLIEKFSPKTSPETDPNTPASSTTPKVVKPATQGKSIKDKNGKTWLYTGNAADPKTDKDPSHWTAQ